MICSVIELQCWLLHRVLFEPRGPLRVLVVWKRAALFCRGGVGIAAAIFGGCGPVFRISGVWAVLAGSGALERRFEPVMVRFPAEQAPA